MAKDFSRRSLLQISGLTSIVGFLAACTSGIAPGGAPQGSGNSIVPAAETIDLKWETFRAPGIGWNEERIETFHEAHPNINIELRPLNSDTQQGNYEKMYAAFAAGDLGDIIAFDPSHYHFWRAIDHQIIMPFDDLVEGAHTDLQQWYEQFMALQYHNGKLYGLPSWGYAGLDTLVTNGIHFKDAGIELPDPTSHNTSMETIGEWARQLYKENERVGLAVVHGEAMLAVLPQPWNANLLNEEGTKCMILDDENVQAAFTWLYDLTVKDKVVATSGSVGDNATASQLGRIAMNWATSLHVQDFKSYVFDPAVGEVAQILLPACTDGKFPSQLRGGTWNILNGTPHPVEAYQFVEHITNTEGCYGFNVRAGEAAYVRPDVMQRLIDDEPIYAWFLPNLQNGIAAIPPKNSRGQEYTDACAQHSALLFNSNQPIEFEKGLQDLHNAIQTVLDMDPA